MFGKMNFHYVKKEKRKPFPPPNIFESILTLGNFVERYKNNIYLNDKNIGEIDYDEYVEEIEENDYSLGNHRIRQIHESMLFSQENQPIKRNEIPFEMPFERSIERFIERSIERSIEKSIEKSLERPVEIHVERHVEIPVERPVETPTERPVEIPVEIPIEITIERPVEITIERPMEIPIETPIETQKSKHKFQGIVGLVKSKIDKIHMVYQSFYKDKHATGFGDFIRGSYFILQFCEKFQFSSEITISHPLHKFLKKQQSVLNPNVCSNITFYDNIFKNNIVNNELQKDFFHHLNSVPIQDNLGEKCVHVYTNAFTINKNISNHHKERMKEILEPCDFIQEKVNRILSSFNLVKKNYIVVHVRSGDSHLIQKEGINVNKFRLIYNEIKKLSLFKLFPNKILLLSDSLELKRHLVKYLPFKCLFHEITHMGEGISLESQDEKLINTLVDFSLFTNAARVFSFSFYEHGSGFSEWACKTYGVPYQCKYISI